MTPTILLVEDDPVIAQNERDALERDGYRVEHRATGEAGVEAVRALLPDLVVLDVGLPGMDGLQVLRQLKSQFPKLPVVLASARAEEVDRVVGLEMGADDYVTKPFSLRELSARVKARLRSRFEPAPPVPEKILLGRFTADVRRRVVHRPEGDTRLTTTEAALLGYLVARPGESVSREALLEEVWEEGEALSLRKVDGAIKKLRAKIEEEPSSPRHVLTVHGKGYRYEP